MASRAQPYEDVALCTACWREGHGHYLPVRRAGEACIELHDDYRDRVLVKRRLYICPAPSCRKGFLLSRQLASHLRYEHQQARVRVT